MSWLGWLFAPLTVAVGYLLWREVRNRRQLRAWLHDPENTNPPDGDGPWAGIFARLYRLQRDVRRVRGELRESLARFQRMVESLPDGVLLIDGSGHIAWFNESARAMFGLDAARDVGTLAEQLIRHRGFRALLEDFRQGREASPLMLDEGFGASRRMLALTPVAFGDSDVMILAHDVSDAARTEAMRRDFIANVSHELRTPLTVVGGFLETLDGPQPPEPDALRRMVTLMADQSRRMTRLVEDLLTLSRLESEPEPSRTEVVDVPALVESLAGEARALSGGRHHIVVAEASGGRVRASGEELRSAFGNLVSNAVRYTPDGGTITLRWLLEQGVPVFAVTDTGIGIPEEHIPRLTERFYRVDKGRSTATGGTGLGLAIVKHVLQRHGGRLRITSVPGEGSTFSALLSAERAVP